MACSSKRRIFTDDKGGFRQDLDSWRSKLINCVGIEESLDLLLGTRILEDLNQFKDYKPASVSNWSFDENCLFCCLRQEKVKEHVIALNNKIVESGGKPLLGKNHCNISRLEWQVEEFLNAVLHWKEYTPRIPDPHIPVVACDAMQQMINHLLMHYTSRKNSQASPQHNGMEQSLLNIHSSTSPIAFTAPTAAASTQSPVLSKLLMEDQDTPLDLSVKKGRAEISEQDVVLDLSIKKNRDPDNVLLRSPHLNLTPPVKRQAPDSGFAKARQLQPSTTLQQLMAKLCLHHQRQIVDAFGFLQTEVKAAASSHEVQVSTPVIQEETVSLDSAPFQETPENQETIETSTLLEPTDKNGSQDSLDSKNVSPPEQPQKTDGSLIATVKNGSSIDNSQTDIGDNNEHNIECSSTDIQPNCPTLLFVKNVCGNPEAKIMSDVDLNIQQPIIGTLEQDPCASDMQSHTHSTDHDIGTQSSCSRSHVQADPECLPVCSNDNPVKPCSILRTTNIILTNSSRTAKKSSIGSQSRLKLGPTGNIANDPDIKCDIVYVAKPITECKLQSSNHMSPRTNARKSTRGHLYFGDCWEVKTVRTLARRITENGSGNYPVPMPEITTSITPKQALSKPDGLPAMTVPFTGDCMETVINRNLSDQSVVTEIPGDVVEITSEDLIVEPSQTGQTQQKEQIPCLLSDEECESFVQQDSNVDNSDISDGNERTPCSNITNEATFTTKEPIVAPSSVILNDLETDVQSQNVATEAMLNTGSSSVESDVSEIGLEEGNSMKCENSATCNVLTKSPEQSKCLTNVLMTHTDNSTMLQMTSGTELNMKATNSTSPDKVELVSDLVFEEITTKEPKSGECLEDLSESFVVKKNVAKHTLPSDRCLRSAGSKVLSGQTTVTCISDQKTLADLQSDTHERKVPESKQSLMSSKSKHSEAPCQGGQCNVDVTDCNLETVQQSSSVTHIDNIGNNVCTRHKQKEMMSDEEQKVQALQSSNDEIKEHNCTVNNAPENDANTPASSESPGKNSPGRSIKVSEKMLLRNRSSPIAHSFSSDSCSPNKNIPRTPERMPVKCRNTTSFELAVDGESCSALNTCLVEKPGRMSLRKRNSDFAEQTVGKDSCFSSNESSLEFVTRTSLRSRNRNAGSNHVSEDPSDVIKNTSGIIIEQPSGEDSCISSKKLSSPGHMPLRSGSGLMVEQSLSCSSVASDAGSVSDSPGRMSLRRSNTFGAEKQDCLPTPPKGKKLSPRLQKMSGTSVPSLIHKGEHNVSGNVKTNQMKVFSISHSFTSFNLATTSPVIPSPCKFLEVLNGEANQQLISDLNSRFDKMQKGWIQMDKEGQPAPKPKNKADRLKEIWKSKRRIRKPRSLEQHKFSPVQMLFMKSFELPNICRWFLQSTETRSLVIVKKVNTRLPSETQLGFQTSTSVQGSSDGVFPSIQAERLKKHLKKFAIASPVKSNPKNKRLIAKALADGISKGKEKREPRAAARISSKPQSSSGLIQALENHNKVGTSTKNTATTKHPTSARILRKYSNMREKKQVQQNSLNNLKRSLIEIDKSHSVIKKDCKEKLSTRRGRSSAIAHKVKRLAKNTKAPANKQNISKGRLRDLNEKNEFSPKRVHPRVLKSNLVSTPKTNKEILVKNEKSPQTKTDYTKSPLHKGPESSTLLSQITNMKPLLGEDQVLTRSQRKMEAVLAQNGSPKTSAKRGMETPCGPVKRTRTSK